MSESAANVYKEQLFYHKYHRQYCNSNKFWSIYSYTINKRTTTHIEM